MVLAPKYFAPNIGKLMSEQANREADRKAKADVEVDSFDLTGDGIDPNQNDMFGNSPRPDESGENPKISELTGANDPYEQITTRPGTSEDQRDASRTVLALLQRRL